MCLRTCKSLMMITTLSAPEMLFGRRFNVFFFNVMDVKWTLKQRLYMLTERQCDKIRFILDVNSAYFERYGCQNNVV